MNKLGFALALIVASAVLARFAPAQDGAAPAAQAPSAPAAAGADGAGAPASQSEAQAAAAPAPAAPQGSNAGSAATPGPLRPADDDVFVPSEEVQADEEITFPVDI
jgi:hypothetical protein